MQLHQKGSNQSNNFDEPVLIMYCKLGYVKNTTIIKEKPTNLLPFHIYHNLYKEISRVL